jgi:hypothetical protein
MPLSDQIVAVNRYAVTGPAIDFGRAAALLADRVRDQGHPGIISYRFFTAGPVAFGNVLYADARAWLGHHATAMDWPEMAALRAAARLVDITLLGGVTPDIRDWLDRNGLAAILTVGQMAGGFVRGQPFFPDHVGPTVSD